MCFLQIDSNFVFLSPPWIIHHSIDILDLENYVLSQANLILKGRGILDVLQEEKLINKPIS